MFDFSNELMNDVDIIDNKHIGVKTDNTIIYAYLPINILYR